MGAGDWDDDFNRANSATVGEGWVESESGSSTCAILDNAAVINRVDDAVSMVKSSITPDTPDRLDCRFKTLDNTKRVIPFSIREGTTAKLEIDVESGQIRYYDGSQNNIVALASDTYVIVSLRNINFTSDTYDIWVDNVEKVTGVSFISAAAVFNSWRCVAGDIGSMMTIDWMDISSPVSITVTPSALTLSTTAVGPTIIIMPGAGSLTLSLSLQAPGFHIVNNTHLNPNIGTKSTKEIATIIAEENIGQVLSIVPESSTILSKKRVGLELNA